MNLPDFVPGRNLAALALCRASESSSRWPRATATSGAAIARSVRRPCWFPWSSASSELTVLFTRRTAHLHDHAGQISFPGGRAEPGDAGAAETAMRETREEIGLAAERVEVLGELPQYVTVTGYRVTPVVGLVTPPLDLKLDDFEVAEVFEAPLAFLLDTANHQRNHVLFDGQERYYYAIPVPDSTTSGAPPPGCS